MDNQLIELSRTSDSIYYAVCLPKGAHEVFGEHTNSYGDKVIWFQSYRCGYLKSENIILNLTPESYFDLLGTIDTLTEDQAREIIPPYKMENWDIIESIPLLYALMKIKGLNTSDNKVCIIKVKL